MTERDKTDNPKKDGRQKERRSSVNLEVRLKKLGRCNFKRQTFYALENIKRGDTLAKIFGCGLFVLIVLNAIAVFIDTQPGLNPVSAIWMYGFFSFSTVCFLVEYICRIWIADLAYGNVTPVKARLKYVFSPMGIVDFLSFAPTLIAWFLPGWPALQHVVGVIRLVRLLKVTRYMRGFRTIWRVLSKHYHEIVASFLVILLLTLVSSVIMYEAESKAQPNEFNSIFQGIWWAVETVTGTGYGDIVPITAVGKFFGGLTMFLALGLIAIPGGILSAGFVAEFSNANLRRIEGDIRHDQEEEEKRLQDSEKRQAEESSGHRGEK